MNNSDKIDINNTNFIQNKANNGAGINFYNTNLQISNSFMLNNTAFIEGGAIFFQTELL